MSETSEKLQSLAPYIEEVSLELANFLIEKNRAYGNSVGDPVMCFSKLDWEERMFVRLDDKISRLMRGHEYPGDDTFKDLAGYLILHEAIKRHQEAVKNAASDD